MIYKATNLIKQEIDKQDLNCSIKEYDDSSDVIACYNIENRPTMQSHCISSDDEDDCSV